MCRCLPAGWQAKPTCSYSNVVLASLHNLFACWTFIVLGLLCLLCCAQITVGLWFLIGYCSNRMKDARNIPREGGFGGGGAYQKLKKGVPLRPARGRCPTSTPWSTLAVRQSWQSNC